MNNITGIELDDLHDAAVQSVRYLRTREAPYESEYVWVEMEIIRDREYVRIGPVLTMSFHGNGMAFFGNEIICQIDIQDTLTENAHFHIAQGGVCKKITIGLNSGSKLSIFIPPGHPCVVEKITK